MQDNDPRIQECLRLWEKHAPKLGISTQGYTHELLWQKQDPWRDHVVLHMKGPEGSFVLKQKKSNDKVIWISEAQNEAALALQDHPIASVPEVYFTDIENDLLIMDYFDGDPITMMLEQPQKRSEYLHLLGIWADAFHSATKKENRIFQPHFMVNFLGRNQKAIEAGKTQVTERNTYLRCVKKIPEIAEQFVDQKTWACQLHGDMNVRNFLFGDNRVAAFDFKPIDHKPIGYDVTRILLDFCEIYAQPDELEVGKIVPSSISDPFFEGYEFCPITDPSIGFLQYTRLLADWRSIPVDPSERSTRQEFRLENILKLAEVGFDL